MKVIEETPDTCSFLDHNLLGAWAQFYITRISKPGLLEYFGSNDMRKQAKYDDGLKKYWLDFK